MKFNEIIKPRCGLEKLLSLPIIGMILLMFSAITAAESPAMSPQHGQGIFGTPELAAQALVNAISDRDKEAMDQILGPDHSHLLQVGEVDPVDRDNFLAAWSDSYKLIPEGDQQRVLAVGKNDWTLPIPIVQGSSGWFFDVDAGAERIRIRRIGRNELAAMQAVLAYYDAQMEYAEQDRDGNGVLEYAQKFRSSPGKHDGLYWEVVAGENQSPLGPLFAETPDEGDYHGYHYRILTSQGMHARGGTYNYLINGRMAAGFALIAWPAEYGDSGIMSFMVSHNGIIYEQDLGIDSASLASALQHFDPTPAWKPVEEVHKPQVSENKE